MAIFGWAVLAALAMFLTAQALFLFWFCMPKYNPIGGAETPIYCKVLVIAYFVLLYFAWSWLMDNVPMRIVAI